MSNRHLVIFGFTRQAVDLYNRKQEEESLPTLAMNSMPGLFDLLKRMKLVPNDARLDRGFELVERDITCLRVEHEKLPEVKECAQIPQVAIGEAAMKEWAYPTSLIEVPMEKKIVVATS